MRRCASERPELLVLADSRRGLEGFPPLGFKMNAAELGPKFSGAPRPTSLPARHGEQVEAATLAGRNTASRCL